MLDRTSDPSIPFIGSRIVQPGMYSRVPMRRYHSADICDGPSVSSSGLRTIVGKSLKHFYARSALNPQRREDATEKRHFILGRAVHHLVLGEASFTKLFVEQPAEYDSGKGWKPWSNHANICKRWNEEQRRRGKTPLKPDEIERIRAMMLSLAQEPFVTNGNLNGAIERSFFWQDRRTRIWLKARPDVVPWDSNDANDLKITRSTDFLDCQAAIGIGRRGYGYIQQGALIAEAWRRVLGREMNAFTLVFIEHEYPHDVRVMEIEKEDLKRGHDLNEYALDRLWKALKNQEWPGRAGIATHVQSLGLSDRDREYVDNIIKLGAIN